MVAQIDVFNDALSAFQGHQADCGSSRADGAATSTNTATASAKKSFSIGDFSPF